MKLLKAYSFAFFGTGFAALVLLTLYAFIVIPMLDAIEDLPQPIHIKLMDTQGLAEAFARHPLAWIVFFVILTLLFAAIFSFSLRGTEKK